jgi:glycosyltransferase involved in cell wall biosynthesis
MKKIGIDARFYGPKSTGVGIHVEELIKNLAKLDQVNQYYIFLKLENFKNIKLPGKNFIKVLSPFNHYSWQEQWSFFWQLKRFNLDLMIFPQFNAPFLYRRPYLVTIHDLTLHFFPGKKKKSIFSRLAYKFLIKNVAKNAKHCFAVSENTKKDMIKILKVSPKKITVTYNGVKDIFKPIKNKDLLIKFKKEYNLPERYLLYTGVRRSHKNIVGLIKAFSLFKKEKPQEKISLVLAGPQDSVYSEIQATVKAENLEKEIIFLGIMSNEDLLKLINSSFAYIFPSFYEGFGIPVLEAMSCGVPVLSSNTSSLKEAGGNAACYFDPYNLKDISVSIKKICEDKKLRNSLKEKGLKHAKKFTWEKMSKIMYQKYLEYLKK